MRLWSAFRCLLPVLALVGIVSGPFATPMNGPAMAAATMSEMPDDMSGCPAGEQPAVPDCETGCPLGTACAAGCFQSVPILSTSAFAFRMIGYPIRTGNDVFGNPLAVTPLDRPPRT